MMNNKYYVSSVAFREKNIDEIINTCENSNLNLEFSSGLPYDSEMEEKFLSASVNKLVHNYFPAPKEAFVLNLASVDESVRIKSINLCKKGIMLTANSNAPFYAAHAGFIFDPDPNELGKNFTNQSYYNKAESYNRFLQSVNELVSYAEKYNVVFCIENNVLTKVNFNTFGFKPFFGTEASELIDLKNKLDSEHFSILLDTAHLKISSNTLNLDLHDQINKVLPHIFGVHHSDCNGYYDTNDPVTSHYWFLKYMPSLADKIHVLEVKNQTVKKIKSQINILKSRANKVW